MASYYLSNNNLYELILRLLTEATLIAPVDFNGRNLLEEITAENAGEINLHGYRTIENIKSFIFRIAQKVAAYFADEVEPKRQNLIILGARACDLSALEVTDKIFLEGDYVDQAYQANRAKLTIITADCTDCGPTCFCPLVKGEPYATKGFDLNFSPLEKGYHVEVGSKRGEKIVTENQNLFQSTKGGGETDKLRRAVTAKLAAVNQAFPITKELSLIHKINLENQVWRKLAKDCVECSACNYACPSCTCFLLLDAKNQRQDTRTKVWDACLKNGYARVAGGANSRPKLYERLQNRYHCKFDYSFDRLGRYTCVGCGRCIDGCAGNIDMRKIFVELEKQAPLTAKLE